MYFSHCIVTCQAFSPPAHLVFWLRKVTGHRCIDVSRRHRAEVEQLNDDMPEPASPFREPRSIALSNFEAAGGDAAGRTANGVNASLSGRP